MTADVGRADASSGRIPATTQVRRQSRYLRMTPSLLPDRGRRRLGVGGELGLSVSSLILVVALVAVLGIVFLGRSNAGLEHLCGHNLRVVQVEADLANAETSGLRSAEQQEAADAKRADDAATGRRGSSCSAASGSPSSSACSSCRC